MAHQRQLEGDAKDQAIQIRANARLAYNSALGELSIADEAVGAVRARFHLGMETEDSFVAALQTRQQRDVAVGHALKALEEGNVALGVANERASQVAAGVEGGEGDMGGDDLAMAGNDNAGQPEVVAVVEGGEGGMEEDDEVMTDDMAPPSEDEHEDRGESDEDMVDNDNTALHGAVNSEDSEAHDEADTAMPPTTTITAPPTTTTTAPAVAPASTAAITQHAPVNTALASASPAATLSAQPVASFINSDYRDRRVAHTMTLGLPRADYAAMQASGFQHDWMTRLNLAPALLDVFKSKYALKDIVGMKAIIVGDEFYCSVKISATHTELRTATVTAINGNLPTLALRTQNTNAQGQAQVVETLPNCSGPKVVLARFWAMQPLPANKKPKAAVAWDAVELRRNGVALGTMNHVRHSLHRWNIEMAVWNNGNGV